MGNKNFIKECIAVGKLPYADKIQLIGRNSAISSSAETIHNVGGTYTQLLAGVAMEVVSASAADTAVGTGARTVRVDWIDGNYVAGSEVITLNGVTPVPLVKTSVIAINGITVLTAGAGLENAGDITVRVIAGAVVKAAMANTTELKSISQDFIYTIPDNYIGLLGNVSYGATAITGDLTVWIVTKDVNGLIIGRGGHKSSLYNTGFNGAQGVIDFGSGLLIPEKTQLEARALVSAGAGSIFAQAELLLFDVKNVGLF